jgi:hypothetical protein
MRSVLCTAFFVKILYKFYARLLGMAFKYGFLCKAWRKNSVLIMPMYGRSLTEAD